MRDVADLVAKINLLLAMQMVSDATLARQADELRRLLEEAARQNEALKASQEEAARQAEALIALREDTAHQAGR